MAHLDEMTRYQRKFLFRSCVLKRRYSIEPPLSDMTWRAYPCRFCNGWHVTRKKISDEGSPHSFAIDLNWQDG